MFYSQQSSYLSKQEKLEGAYKGVWGVGAFKWGHKGGGIKGELWVGGLSVGGIKGGVHKGGV